MVRADETAVVDAVTTWDDLSGQSWDDLEQLTWQGLEDLAARAWPAVNELGTADALALARLLRGGLSNSLPLRPGELRHGHVVPGGPGDRLVAVASRLLRETRPRTPEQGIGYLTALAAVVGACAAVLAALPDDAPPPPMPPVQIINQYLPQPLQAPEPEQP